MAFKRQFKCYKRQNLFMKWTPDCSNVINYYLAVFHLKLKNVRDSDLKPEEPIVTKKYPGLIKTRPVQTSLKIAVRICINGGK